MTECPSCNARVRPGQEECEHCGFPLDDAAPRGGRATRIEDASPPERGRDLFRPGGRKTQIEPAAASSAPAPPPDAADPFRRALADAPPRRRRTMIGAAAASDPFAAALTGPPATSTELERPLAGVLVTFSGAPNGRVFPLTLGRTVVGRDPGPPAADVLTLDDDSVSNVHCVVVAREAGVMVKDEMSSNGTLLRSEGDAGFRDILAETVMLRDGDQLKLGETVLLLRLFDRDRIAAIWGAG